MALANDSEGADEQAARARIYCLVPSALGPKLHGLLVAHFRDDPTIEVIVDRRDAERRCVKGRRREEAGPPAEGDRRRTRAVEGRRVAERRAAVLALEAVPELPRRARRYAEQITFVERLEPSAQLLEDHDTAYLVARFQAGDRALYADLYNRYFDRVYAYLRVALDDAHEAEDVAQQVFTHVLASLDRYQRRRQPFRAWLFTIVRNQAVSRLRKAGRTDVTEPAELLERYDRDRVPPPSIVFDWIADSDLMMLVERLPTPQRQALMMRYVLDLSTAEIARAMGRSPTDVRTLQHRALRFLERRLTALGRGPRARRPGAMRRSMRPANVLRARRFALLD